MKKRVKLLTTIASLCLAVALMAFGVYAATTVTLGVNSTVSFDAKDVYVTIVGNQYKGATGATAAEGTGNLAAEYSYNTETMAPNATDPDVHTWNVAELKLDTTNRGFKLVVEITNNGTDTIYVEMEDGTTTTDTNFTDYTVTETLKAGGNYVAATGLESNATYVFTVYATIEDVTTSANLVLDVDFTISRTAPSTGSEG